MVYLSPGLFYVLAIIRGRFPVYTFGQSIKHATAIAEPCPSPFEFG